VVLAAALVFTIVGEVRIITVLDVLLGNLVVDVVDTLAVIAGMKHLVVTAALWAVVLALTFAYVISLAVIPDPLLVHGALAEFAATSSPFTAFATLSLTVLLHSPFISAYELLNLSRRDAAAEFVRM